jgi:hypothetical protein
VFVQSDIFLQPPSLPRPSAASVNDCITQRESHLRYTAGRTLRRIQHSSPSQTNRTISISRPLVAEYSADLGYASM